MTETYCGYVALLGRPNSGKSTLLNACLGQKIVGVSSRPQTTRNRILGIDMVDARQIVFLDSPGIHNAGGKPRINHTMNKVAWSVAAEADIICYLVDAVRGWSEEDQVYLTSLLRHATSPVWMIVTKADAVKKEKLNDCVDLVREQMASIKKDLSETEECSEKSVWYLSDEPCQVSAKRKDRLKEFRTELASYLPEGPWLYDPENLTDKPESFIVGELIRENLFRRLSEELPDGCGVRIEKIHQNRERVHVKATIIVSRESHKPMVIGKQGQGIKAIGTISRESLERHYDKKVRLDLFVRVDEGWVNDPELIANYQQIEDPW